MISWASMKQKNVALGTVEVEYIATCDTCMKSVWLLKMIYGLFHQVLDSTVIYCDNRLCETFRETHDFMTGRSTLRSSIVLSVINSRRESDSPVHLH
jgi:hypothetical protein